MNDQNKLLSIVKAVSKDHLIDFYFLLPPVYFATGMGFTLTAWSFSDYFKLKKEIKGGTNGRRRN